MVLGPCHVEVSVLGTDACSRFQCHCLRTDPSNRYEKHSCENEHAEQEGGKGPVSESHGQSYYLDFSLPYPKFLKSLEPMPSINNPKCIRPSPFNYWW